MGHARRILILDTLKLRKREKERKKIPKQKKKVEWFLFFLKFFFSDYSEAQKVSRKNRAFWWGAGVSYTLTALLSKYVLELRLIWWKPYLNIFLGI